MRGFATKMSIFESAAGHLALVVVDSGYLDQEPGQKTIMYDRTGLRGA